MSKKIKKEKFKVPTKSIYFDVDGTLVRWPKLSVHESFQNDPRAVKFELMGMTHWLIPHETHIKELIEWHNKGWEVIVWSAGAKEWGQVVVKKLGLSKYVSAILSKPDYFYDDMPSHYILHPHRRIFKRDK